MPGDEVVIFTDAGPSSRVFSFEGTNQTALTVAHNPKDEAAALLVRGVGVNQGSTRLIELDADVRASGGDAWVLRKILSPTTDDVDGRIVIESPGGYLETGALAVGLQIVERC